MCSHKMNNINSLGICWWNTYTPIRYAFKKHIGPNRLFNMKSHDHHVMLQNILPTGIQNLLHHGPRKIIIYLGKIFQMLCKKVLNLVDVATLALGLRLRQGFARVRAKKEAQKSHFMLSKVQKSEGMNSFTLPRELPLWGVGVPVDSRWTLEFLECDFRGQNSLDSGVPYIIGKILKHRCLKWACMTHLDI
jgi:hypothetical protein